MHHGNLNIHQPISASSESKTSVLIIVWVMSEVPDDVPSLIRITSIVYYSMVIGFLDRGVRV